MRTKTICFLQHLNPIRQLVFVSVSVSVSIPFHSPFDLSWQLLQQTQYKPVTLTSHLAYTVAFALAIPHLGTQAQEKKGRCRRTHKSVPYPYTHTSSIQSSPNTPTWIRPHTTIQNNPRPANHLINPRPSCMESRRVFRVICHICHPRLLLE